MKVSQPSTSPYASTPTNTLFSVTATPGTSSLFSRGDHSHGQGASAPATPSTEAFSGVAAVGTGDDPAKEDHVHKLPHVERKRGLDGVTAWTFAGAFTATPIVVGNTRFAPGYAVTIQTVSTTAVTVRTFDTNLQAYTNVTCDAIAMDA